jgi:hypothetical protein
MEKSYYLGLIVAAAGLATVHADIIPSFSSATPTGGNFTWSYTSNVTVDEMVNPGDFFTIYDFGTFVVGSNSQRAGWTFSSSLTGTNPSLVTPADNPTLLNLTWTYTGATAINGASALGTFSVVAATNQLRTSDFAAEATRNSGPTAGTKVDNVGTISVPIPEMSSLMPIFSVCAAALLSGLPTYLRRRK